MIYSGMISFYYYAYGMDYNSEIIKSLTFCFGLYYSCACGHIFRYPDVAAYGSVFSDGDTP